MPEILHPEILSGQVYRDWQAPCSDVEFFLARPQSLTAWIVRSSAYEDINYIVNTSVCITEPRALTMQIVLDRDHIFVVYSNLRYAFGAYDAYKLWFDRMSRGTLLLQAAPETPGPEATDTFAGEQQWIEQHRAEFVGKWVALKGGQLLAAGNSAKLVYRQALTAGIRRPLVVKVEPSEQPPFAGW